MKYLLVFLGLFIHLITLHAQNDSPDYSRVKIDLRHTPIEEVARLGLEVDHGIYAKGRHLINDFSKREIAMLKAQQIPYEILIEDVVAYYVSRNQASHDHDHDHDHTAHSRSVNDCDGGGGGLFYDYVTPTHYQDGSMGGYLTYDELLITLDSMSTLYPNLITVKTGIDTIRTHEGRPIYWLRLSDNPNQDEDEPEVLYTALHHAREPNGLSQMIFYIWYLLENYDTDPEIKYLVDHTEMYFIPCINPDGYIYNETIAPNGGGLWRKNRWVDNGTTYGVDLNRNYGYEWGFDDIGSSTDPDNDTYRGTSAFSEPETQAVRNFCNAHQFKITLNYHTFGNLLIYPWGYSDQPTPDHETFTAFSQVMIEENIFTAGTGTETVGYTVNGDSDDWMYGEADSKPPIFSMTPEVGRTGFWPAQSEIDQLNKSCLRQNLAAAHLLLNYGEAEEQNASDLITSTEGTIELNVKKYGLLDGDLSLRLSSINNRATLTTTQATTWALSHLDDTSATFDFTLANDVVAEEELLFLVEVDNGTYAWTDTLRKRYTDIPFTTLLVDGGGQLGNWDVVGDWGISTITFFSAPSSYTDSPGEEYDSDMNATMTLIDPINLEGALSAQLSFQAQWDIENDYDYVQVLASTDGQNFTPLCGKYTNFGTRNQAEDEPLYDGVQADWVLEEMDLSDYIGTQVWIRFQLITDRFVQGDGFYFDDLTISIQPEESTATADLPTALTRFQAFPNPFKEALNLHFELTETVDQLDVRLTNLVGQVVDSRSIGRTMAGVHQLAFDYPKLVEGVYFLQLFVDGIKVDAQKVVKLK